MNELDRRRHQEARRRDPRWSAISAIGVSDETAIELHGRCRKSPFIASGLDAWQHCSAQPLAEWLVKIILTQDDENQRLRDALLRQEQMSITRIPDKSGVEV